MMRMTYKYKLNNLDKDKQVSKLVLNNQYQKKTIKMI